MRFDTVNKIPLKYVSKRGFRDRRGLRCKHNVGTEFKRTYEREIGLFKTFDLDFSKIWDVLTPPQPSTFNGVGMWSLDSMDTMSWSFSGGSWGHEETKDWRQRARK